MNEDICFNKYFDEWKSRIEALILEHPLQIISWESTRRCDLNCLHCGSPSEEVSLDDELSLEEVVQAFTQIGQDFDMSQFRHINITGGEPFIREDIFNILEKISKFPFYRNIDIQTNGVFIADHPESLFLLKRYGVTGLGISIDGLKDIHDAFRRKKGSFEKAYKAAQISVQNNFVVTISVVAHAKNIEEIPELYRIVKDDIKPRVFRIMIIDCIGRAEANNEYLLSTKQTREVINFLKKKYMNTCSNYSKPDVMMVELGCGGWLGKELEGMVRPYIFHCIAGINNLGILFDGKLASCSNIPREFIEGDLRKDRIKDIWDNRYARYRKFGWKKVGECATCDQWEFCHGGPMHKCSLNGDKSKCIFYLLHLL